MADRSTLQDAYVRADQEGRPRSIEGSFEMPMRINLVPPIKSLIQRVLRERRCAINQRDLAVIQDVVVGSGRVVRFQQTRDGIPIFGTEIIVTVDRSQHATRIDLCCLPHNHLAPRPGKARRLRPTELIEKAVSSLRSGPDSTIGEPIPTPRSREAYFSTPTGLRLAAIVLIRTQKPEHEWQVIVDTYTGEVLRPKRDLIVGDWAWGKVFLPNPVVCAQRPEFRAPSADASLCQFDCQATPQIAIDSQRIDVKLLDLERNSNGNVVLHGPYVKIVNLGSSEHSHEPDINLPEKPLTLDGSPVRFDYSSDQDEFEAVMAYYHVDTVQRYIQQELGIYNANNRQILCDSKDNGYLAEGGIFPQPHCHSDGSLGFSSPRTATVEEGGHPKGICVPDRAEDADCILHEYAHSILRDQKNDYAGHGHWDTISPETGRAETAALKESFADILATLYFAPEHNTFQPDVFEDWTYAHRAESNYGGQSGLRSMEGTRKYSQGWGSDQYQNSLFWSNTMWDIYLAMGGASGDLNVRIGARNELLKTHLLSNFRISNDASLPRAAEVFTQQYLDLEEYQAIHAKEILQGFHDHTILECAEGSHLEIIGGVAHEKRSDLRSMKRWVERLSRLLNSTSATNRRKILDEIAKMSMSSIQEIKMRGDNWFSALIVNTGQEAARTCLMGVNYHPVPVHRVPPDPQAIVFNGRYTCGSVGFELKPFELRILTTRLPNRTNPFIKNAVILAEVWNPVDNISLPATIAASQGKLHACRATISW